MTLTLTGRINRPPMERTPAVAALYEQARPIGKSLGLDLAEGGDRRRQRRQLHRRAGRPHARRPRLPRVGAHADYEHILIDGLLERAALLGALLLEL